MKKIDGKYQFYAVDPVRVTKGKGRIKIEETWPYNSTGKIFNNINHIAVISYSSASNVDDKHFTWSANNTSSGATKKENTSNNQKQNSIVIPNVNVNLTSKPTEILVGQSSPIRGTISANYPIYYVSGTIIDSNGNNVIPWVDLSYNGTYNISIGAKHALNTKMTFDSIKSPGNYKIRIIVNCNKDGSSANVQTRDFDFTVKSAEQCKQPNITVSSLEEGQRVTITSSDGGYLHYNLNGGYGGEGSSITKDLTTAGSYNFYAWETKSGYNDSPAITRSVSVQKSDTPIIGDVKYGANNAWVTISGTGNIYYTQNGSNPSKKAVHTAERFIFMIAQQ